MTMEQLLLQAEGQIPATPPGGGLFTSTIALPKPPTLTGTPAWRLWGWPSEGEYVAAGSPEVEYQVWQQAQQDAQAEQAMNAMESVLVAEQEAQAPVAPTTGMVAPRSGLLNQVPSFQAPPTDFTEGSLRIEGTPRERLLQQRQGGTAFGAITEPIGEAISESPLGTAYRGIESGLDYIGDVQAARSRMEPTGLTTTPGFQAASDVIRPREPWELAFEATPLGAAGDIAALRRPIGELPFGAAESLVRGTPVEDTLLAGPGIGRQVPAPRPPTAGAAPTPEEELFHGLPDEAASAMAGRPTAPSPAPGGAPVTPGAPTAVMEPPAPVSKLTDLVNQARKLPAETEALRTQRRRQQAAIISSTLERGGRSPEAFRMARGSLAGELPRADFEAPAINFSPEETQQFRNVIGQAGLRPFEEISAEEALTKVLDGRLNQVQRNEIELLDRVFGSDLSLAVAQKAAPPSFADKVYEFWLSSILSGPITQARNIVGNTAAALTSPVERIGSSALETVVAPLTGRQRERFWQEVPEQVIGMAQGVPQGVAGALRAWKSGLGQSALTESATRVPAISGLKGRIIRAPLTGLEAMDAFFGAINFEGARRALAVRQARKEGLRGDALELRISDLIANPPEELIDEATEEKLHRLFRDDPTRYGQAIMDFRNKAPATRFLVPFARTPDRLLAYGIRRSPLGLLDYSMWDRLVRGQPQAVDDLARTLMGSTAAMGLGALVANGQLDITGPVPSLAAERDRFFREGKQPFSVKIPGAGWVQYSQIPGLDVALTTLASAKDSFEKGERIDGAVAEMGANIASNIFDRSYVSGLADFLEIFSGGGFEDPKDAGLRWAGRQVSGAVPFSAAARQTGQFFDQTVYRPQGLAEELATGVGAGGTGIPGLVDQVPSRLTAFGEEAERAFPSPVTVSPDTQTAIDAELGRLGKEVGFVGKSIGGRQLTREQQQEYQRVAGQETQRLLGDLINSPLYASMSDILKEKAVERAINKARDMARDRLNLQFAQEQLAGTAR